MLPVQHAALHRAVERTITHHAPSSTANCHSAPRRTMSAPPSKPPQPASSSSVYNYPSHRGPATRRQPAGAGHGPSPHAKSNPAEPRRHRTRPSHRADAAKKAEPPTAKARPAPRASPNQQHYPPRVHQNLQGAQRHWPMPSGGAGSAGVSYALSPDQARGLLPRTSVATCVLAFDARLIELLYCLAPTADEQADRVGVIKDVGSALRRTGIDVQIYGSLCTGLVIPASDVDCVLTRSADPHVASSMSETMNSAMNDITSSSNGGASPRSVKAALSTAVRTVADRMRRNSQFSNVTCIAHARVPIVKCRHRSAAVQVDLSFEKDGCVSSNYLCELFCEPGNEMARPLIVLIKALVRHAALDDPSIGGLGSFPISLMVLWFLRQCVRPRFAVELQHSISVLLVGFLKYYGTEFDFQHCGIDYVQQRTFPKAPANDLFIVNPIHPGTNCAKAAFQFSGRVVPLFKSAADAFAGLLSADAPLPVLEAQLLHYFSRAAPSVNDWRDVVRRALAATHDPQNMWDTETNMYVGGVV